MWTEIGPIRSYGAMIKNTIIEDEDITNDGSIKNEYLHRRN